MNHATVDQIEQCLKDFNHFQECIILDVVLSDFGTTIELLVNNIWNPDCTLRSNLAEPSVVRLKFETVQEFRLNNALSILMINDMSQLNWGFNEIAAIHVEDAINATSQYGSIPKRFLHAFILWEGNRRMDIIFRDMQITTE